MGRRRRDEEGRQICRLTRDLISHRESKRFACVNKEENLVITEEKKINT